jgi:hypothetical protein
MGFAESLYYIVKGIWKYRGFMFAIEGRNLSAMLVGTVNQEIDRLLSWYISALYSDHASKT